MDPFIEKVRQRRINDKYHLVKKIGEGGYGAVYLGKDAVTGEEVALKLEHCSRTPSTLSEEFDCYEDFRSVPGFPRVDWLGWQDNYTVMVLELLGPSLADVLKYCGGRFSLKTTLMLADQLLDRFEKIHSRGYLHRDVKPSNFLLGTGRHGNMVYVTDFGLMTTFDPESKPESDDDDDECKPKVSQKTVIGTVRYASIRGHVGSRQSPRDDLEALCYMLVSFMVGTLPWQGLQVKEEAEREQQILDIKVKTSAEDLCAGLPPEFAEFMRYTKSLRAVSLPEYGKIRRAFKQLALREDIVYDNVFDWTVRFLVDDQLS